MKKLLLTASVVLLSLSAYAQGTMTFANPFNAPVRDQLDGNTSVTAADNIMVGLYWAPTGSSTFMQLGASVQVGAGQPPGIFNGGSRTTPPETPGGGMAQFQVRAWELAFGSTYEAAAAAPAQGGRTSKLGISNTVTLTTGNPMGMPTPTLPPGNLTGMTAFSVVPVPEPSVVALGILGAGALLLLRRRK